MTQPTPRAIERPAESATKLVYTGVQMFMASGLRFRRPGLTVDFYGIIALVSFTVRSGAGPLCKPRTLAARAYGTTCMGRLRRPIHRDSDTGAMPSRAAALLRLRDSRIATSRRVAFSISGNDEAAYLRTQA